MSARQQSFFSKGPFLKRPFLPKSLGYRSCLFHVAVLLLNSQQSIHILQGYCYIGPLDHCTDKKCYDDDNNNISWILLYQLVLSLFCQFTTKATSVNILPSPYTVLLFFKNQSTHLHHHMRFIYNMKEEEKHTQLSRIPIGNRSISFTSFPLTVLYLRLHVDQFLCIL